MIVSRMLTARIDWMISLSEYKVLLESKAFLVREKNMNMSPSKASVAEHDVHSGNSS